MGYGDDITIRSTPTITSAAKKTYIQFLPGLNITFHIKSRQNNLHSVHSRPCIISNQSGAQNKQYCTTHGNAPKDIGSYLRPKTHIQHTQSHHLSTHSHTISVHTHKHLQIIKVLTATGWDKQKETLMATHKAVIY